MQSNLVKTDDELQKIRQAAKITDDVFDYILIELVEGVTEKAIAAKIYDKTVELGATDVSFDTIVAFGENGCEPHHVPTNRALKRGDLVTIDMGALFEGYCSDFTRTVAYKGVSDVQKNVYSIVLEAYSLALSMVKAGEKCSDVDGFAREYISLCGYGDNFIHGTGHGVGTLIHEPPTLNSKSTELLEKNQVVTVEPGIYLNGALGVRIENMIVVGEKKPLSRHGVQLKII